MSTYLQSDLLKPKSLCIYKDKQLLDYFTNKPVLLPLSEVIIVHKVTSSAPSIDFVTLPRVESRVSNAPLIDCVSKVAAEIASNIVIPFENKFYSLILEEFKTKPFWAKVVSLDSPVFDFIQLPKNFTSEQKLVSISLSFYGRTILKDDFESFISTYDPTKSFIAHLESNEKYKRDLPSEVDQKFSSLKAKYSTPREEFGITFPIDLEEIKLQEEWDESLEAAKLESLQSKQEMDLIQLLKQKQLDMEKESERVRKVTEEETKKKQEFELLKIKQELQQFHEKEKARIQEEFKSRVAKPLSEVVNPSSPYYESYKKIGLVGYVPPASVPANSELAFMKKDWISVANLAQQQRRLGVFNTDFYICDRGFMCEVDYNGEIYSAEGMNKKEAKNMAYYHMLKANRII